MGFLFFRKKNKTKLFFKYFHVFRIFSKIVLDLNVKNQKMIDPLALTVANPTHESLANKDLVIIINHTVRNNHWIIDLQFFVCKMLKMSIFSLFISTYGGGTLDNPIFAHLTIFRVTNGQRLAWFHRIIGKNAHLSHWKKCISILYLYDCPNQLFQINHSVYNFYKPPPPRTRKETSFENAP